MNYVVVGASAAGINGVKYIRQLEPDANITLISKDDHIYSRCILHHYLEGIRDIKALEFVEDGFIEKNNINWIKGVAVEKIEPKQKELILSDGRTVSYDKVLLATGASTFFPPVKNLNDAKNVFGLRNLDDAIEIKEKAQYAKNIVVMGAGLVGIDALTGLLHYGKNLTLVEFKGHMLSIQLDKRAAKTYQDAFTNEGVTQYYDTAVQEVIMDETGAVKALALSNGLIIDCDFLIVATGVRSNVAFLQDSGIECDRFGLIFDEYGRTSDESVYGAGDISGRNPIWPAAVKEAIIAATNMCGHKRELTDFFASKSTMNFLHIPTMSLGTPEPADETYKVDIEEDGQGNYKKIIHKDGVIYGALIQGDLSYSGVLTQLIREKINIDKVEKSIFKIDYSDFFHLTDNCQFTYND
ncbi:NAD(P)/FAD-dependent oxidoreductase [Turicibacter bilis]|uniref:NAD(P)/FAD-dependent oxidoreductase n=1 Tax=Turicibacter bilis TaxID=2735723 RepID=A0A9Q9CF36_9FIRM|nr:FAD-dependent oxidoreductase [Turicibacter bilis]MBS3197696.1 NAD(P)/FAD-dependent oxidoreductase [Turicibacter bilis]UUF07413.1 NAD(P)/FAD-dependent oxidoreductase [Turicibacter bilis]